jgi:hypothetical protein
MAETVISQSRQSAKGRWTAKSNRRTYNLNRARPIVALASVWLPAAGRMLSRWNAITDIFANLAKASYL